MPKLSELALASVTDPAAAARRILALNLPRDVLWTGFALVVVLNTLIYSLTSTLVPGPSPFPELLSSPPVYLCFVAGGLFLIILSTHVGGRAIGGKGSFDAILAVMVWLQALRVAVQAGALVLLLVFPLASGLLVIASGVIGIWLLLHFVDQAHGFGSLGRAGGAVLIAFVGMVAGFSLLVSLMGVSV